jgi:RNA polymerase sigma factor (sigma-70 family)
MPAPTDFDTFFRSEYPRLVGALGVAVGPEAAADAVQEALLRANLRWSRVGRLDRPGAWVRRVALNLLIDDRRRRSRWSPVAEPEPRPVADDEVADLDLRRAIDALPPRQRLAVCLYYLLDQPVSAVADELGVSVGTVKRALHVARRTLRANLEVIDGER